MIPLTDPESYYEEDFHRHVFSDEDGKSIAVVEFDDIEDERGGLWCEATVYCRFAGSDPVIAFQRVNLLATRGGVNDLVKDLDDVGSVNWAQGLKVAKNATVKAYRTASSDGLWLAQPKAEEGDPYLLRPYIASSGVTVLYGPPGSNKSMLSMEWALSIATGKGFDGIEPTNTGPVLYVDFEDSPEPHQWRLAAQMRERELEGEKLIWHERVRGSLKDARRRLRRLVRDEGFVLVVIDSIGLARAADVSGSEATIKLFKMFNQLGASVLALDHMTKEDSKRVWTGKMDAREATPIGSQFTQSSARLAWFINLLPQSTPKRKKVNLYNTKHNHTPQHPPVGMSINLDWDERDRITQIRFVTEEGAFEAMVADAMKMTKSQELLLWHFKQQREDGKVIPMGYKDMERGTDMAYGTISSIVGTKFKAWWEKVEGTHQYVLTDEGLEMAISLSSFYDLSSGEISEGENG